MSILFQKIALVADEKSNHMEISVQNVEFTNLIVI